MKIIKTILIITFFVIALSIAGNGDYEHDKQYYKGNYAQYYN